MYIMKTQELRLYELLKVKIGEEETQLLLETIETKSEATLDIRLASLATKEDVANSRAELIKWMFIFWIGQLGATIAIYKFLI